MVLSFENQKKLITMMKTVMILLAIVAVATASYVPQGYRSLLENSADEEGWRDGRATWYDHPW